MLYSNSSYIILRPDHSMQIMLLTALQKHDDNVCCMLIGISFPHDMLHFVCKSLMCNVQWPKVKHAQMSVHAQGLLQLPPALTPVH